MRAVAASTTVVQLSQAERKLFARCVETIEGGWTVAVGVLKAVATRREATTVIAAGRLTTLEVAEAIVTCKDQELYRESYSTWDDFCKRGLKRSRQSAHQLVQMARRHGKLPSNSVSLFDAEEDGPSHRQVAAAARVRPQDAGTWAAAAQAAGSTAPAELEALRKDLESATPGADESDEAPRAAKAPRASGDVQQARRHVAILRQVVARLSTSVACVAALDQLDAAIDGHVAPTQQIPG